MPYLSAYRLIWVSLTFGVRYLLSAAPRSGTRGSSSQPFLRRGSLVLSAAAPDIGRGVTPLGHRPLGIGSSRLLPLTSDVGWLLSAALWRACRSRLRFGTLVAAKNQKNSIKK